MEKLRPRERALLKQRYEATKSVKELVQESQRTESAVYKMLQRIHDGLYECVQAALSRRAST